MNNLNTVFISSFVCAIVFSTMGASRADDLTARKQALALRCTSMLPPDARYIESIKLCNLNHNGKNEIYACQDFVSSRGRSRVYFQGGRFPRAMARMTAKGDTSTLIWFEPGKKQGRQETRPACDAEPPSPLPGTAQFMGAGVCEEESGELAPCSAFRNRAPRLKYISDYIVLYTGPGRSHLKIWSKQVGINHDAMQAELAYQIGLSLVTTRCCRAKGLKYIQKAMSMYPGATLYQKTYRSIQQQVAGVEDRVTLNNDESN